jgi:hypothetical protein
MKLEFSYEETIDCLTIEGVRYSGHLFRNFRTFPRGQLFMFIDNKDGVVTVRNVRKEEDLILEKNNG